MSDEERKDRRSERLTDLPRGGLGLLYAPDSRVTTYSDRGQPSNYAERLFAGSASRELGKKEYDSMRRSGVLNLVIYAIIGCVCARVAAFSLFCLLVELSTGMWFNFKTGEFMGQYSIFDPAFFVISAALALVLTATFFWSIARGLSKLRMIGQLAEGLPLGSE